MSPTIMGPAHISPWRKTRRRRDACRRRPKGAWSRSQKWADYIIAMNDAQPPDGRRRLVDGSRRLCTERPSVRALRRLKANVLIAASVGRFGGVARRFLP